MQKDRRKFLRKALGVGAVAAVAANAATIGSKEPVSQGKSKKTEVLYHKTRMWEQYYKIAY